jgi:ketosteroid isomerase-like protein
MNGAPDNVERFHELLRHWQERRGLPTEALTEDAEWVNPPDSVETGTRRGPDSFNEAIASVYEGWEDSRFEPARVLASGDDVVALGELRVRGRAVGVEVTREHGQLWTFRGGRLARMRWFNTHRETLEAAGLAD